MDSTDVSTFNLCFLPCRTAKVETSVSLRRLTRNFLYPGEPSMGNLSVHPFSALSGNHCG